MGSSSSSPPGETVAPYPGGPSEFELASVPDRFQRLLGMWEGPYRGYDLQVKTYRPYWYRILFMADACYRVTAGPGSGDILLVGTKAEEYPELSAASGGVLSSKSETGFLIYGLRGGDPYQIFLRTIGSGSYAIDYALEYQCEDLHAYAYVAGLPATSQHPQMTFRIFNVQDPTVDDDTRSVAVGLTVGPRDHPFWHGPIAGGKQYHSSTASSRVQPTPAPETSMELRSVPTSAGTMDIHSAVAAVHRREDARRALRSVLSTIPS
jgi:hypothetical protein